jgi:hypothetical protein
LFIKQLRQRASTMVPKMVPWLLRCWKTGVLGPYRSHAITETLAVDVI